MSESGAHSYHAVSFNDAHMLVINNLEDTWVGGLRLPPEAFTNSFTMKVPKASKTPLAETKYHSKTCSVLDSTKLPRYLGIYQFLHHFFTCQA